MFLLKNAILIFLLFNSINSLQDIQQISQCGNGKATYYGASAGGNCGFGDITGYIDTAAAEIEIYDGNNGCGICYEVIGELGSKIVMIADSCPSCSKVSETGKIHLDLDERIFPQIDIKEKGIIDTSIRMVPCQVNGNVKLHITESNNYYFNAYASNYKIGLNSLQISLNGGDYFDVARADHNRFISNISNLNNIKVKLISISGEEIVCYENSQIIKGDYDCGKQFSVKDFYDLYSRKIIGENEKSECCKKPSLISEINSCKVETNYSKSNNLRFSILSIFLLIVNILF